MAQGSLFTGSYAINGTAFITEPSDGQWLPRKVLGYDGLGHSIYPAVRQFVLNWDYMDMQSFNQLENFYVAQSVTGSVIMDLPQFNRADWYFISYTGCILGELEIGSYFMGNPSKIKLTVNKVITG